MTRKSVVASSNSFPDNMIELTVNKTKLAGLLVRTRAFNLCILTGMFDFGPAKSQGLLRNGPLVRFVQETMLL